MLTVKGQAQTPGKQSPLKERDTENPDSIKGSSRRRVKEWENIAQTMGVS